jgi:hypothetical protein
MDEEQKKAYREKRDRIKKEKIDDFKRRDNFQKQLKEVKLDTFRDKPDAITSTRCVHVEGKLFVVEWDAPASNNSAILRYHVYLSNKKIKINSIGDDQTSGSDTSDFIKVTSIEESKN